MNLQGTFKEQPESSSNIINCKIQHDHTRRENYKKNNNKINTYEHDREQQMHSI